MFKFSKHSKNKHADEKWNPETIKEVVENGKLTNKKLLPGKTADVITGIAPDGKSVGLIVSKPKNGDSVIITGFEAPEDYWKKV